MLIKYNAPVQAHLTFIGEWEVTLTRYDAHEELRDEMLHLCVLQLVQLNYENNSRYSTCCNRATHV